MSKFVVNLTWKDAPHLSEEAKKEIRSGTPPHEIDAVERGIPTLGAGAIYPLLEEDVVIEPNFNISDKWPRAAGMDVGWKKTACIWGAYDRKSDTIYCYSEYYRGYAEPAIHANAIAARGKWMPIAMDCHADRHSEAGAIALLTTYENFGLNVSKANNGPGTLEPSILEVYQRLSTGRLKIMSHLLNTLGEFRVYRRDLNGRIVKKDDHLMDALRYLVMSMQQIMEPPPPDDFEETPRMNRRTNSGQSRICGY
jgi:hypothetical protein